MVLACTTPSPARVTNRVVDVGELPAVDVRPVGALAERDRDRVAATVVVAADRLGRRRLPWRAPVVVTIHGDVYGFVAATGQTVPSLRAWTVDHAVHLLTLDTWRSTDDDDVARRLTHELCHVALTDRLRLLPDPAPLPRLVTEGVCSVVAEQDDERADAAAVADALDAGRAIDFDDDSSFAYAVAHHVIAGLQRCHGDDAVLALVDAVAGRATTTVSLARFLPEPPRALIGACPTTMPTR